MNMKKEPGGVGETIEGKAKKTRRFLLHLLHTCATPEAYLLFSQTISFMKTLPGNPESVAFKGVYIYIRVFYGLVRYCKFAIHV
jgi:hypothetical protein